MSNLLSQCHASFLNLDHRTDRRQHMERELARVGISATRTRGMLPEEVIQHRKLDRARLKVMQNRTPGAIGCHYGQVQIMSDSLEEGKHAFVMEDDLIFCDDFQRRMGFIQDYLKDTDWDVFWLGGTFHVNPPWWHGGKEPCLCNRWENPCPKRDIERVPGHPRFVRTYGAFSTHAYIVNMEKIKKILEWISAIVHLSMGIDWAFIQLQPILRCFAFVPGCVIQMDNQSDIGRGITRFSGFSKLGPYWFQPRMEYFDPTTFNWAEASK